MKTKHVSVVILYAPDKKILLQERGGISKSGEEWAFFGGKIEDGETKEQAAIREIKEELNFELKNTNYLGQVSGIVTDLTGNQKNLVEEVFITKISSDLSQFKLGEGIGMKLFTLTEARKLKIVPVDFKALDLAEKYLQSIYRQGN